MPKTFRIKREFAVKWIDYLLNKGFEQAKGRLHDPINNSYCCLGVGCIVAKDLGFPLHVSGRDAETRFNGHTDVLPDEIIDFAGISNMNGTSADDPQIGPYKASQWNDDFDMDFVVIAALIEAFGEYYD